MLLAITLTHLNDLENACRAYEQAVSLEKEDPLVHLNYAILLYNTDKQSHAAKQFEQFESKFRKYKPANPDPEVHGI